MQLPPVERVDLLESGPGHEPCKSMRAEHRTLVLARQSLQRGHVEVIVVIVADENAVDGRNILEKNSGITVPPWTEKRNGTDPLGPHRISEYIEAFALQQKCRVIHKCNAKLAAANAISRPWSGRGGDESAPWTYLPTSDPIEDFGEALWRHSRIEEAAVLKMIGSAAVSCHSEFCSITMHTQVLAHDPRSYVFDLRIGQVFVATGIGMLF